MIAIYVDKHQKNWDENLTLLTSAYRTWILSQHVDAGVRTSSPHGLAFGCALWTSLELETSPHEFVVDLHERMGKIFQLVRQHLRKTGERQKCSHDTRLAYNSYQAGELVSSRDNIQGNLARTPSRGSTSGRVMGLLSRGSAIWFMKLNYRQMGDHRLCTTTGWNLTPASRSQSGFNRYRTPANSRHGAVRVKLPMQPVKHSLRLSRQTGTLTPVVRVNINIRAGLIRTSYHRIAAVKVTT